jgi:hypothetical protein
MHRSTALLGITFALTTLAPLAVQAEAAAPESVATQSSGAEGQPATELPDAMEEPSVSRFRWGIAANGGPMMGAYSGGAGGLDARFGMQLSSLLGLYAQPRLLVGAGASADAGGASATGLALYGVGAMVDATLADLFYVAGGPEVLIGGVGTAAASSGGSSSASASSGAFFSMAGRTGFAFGSKRPERRKAFTLGLDMHVLFAGGATFLPMVALGYEAF